MRVQAFHGIVIPSSTTKTATTTKTAVVMVPSPPIVPLFMAKVEQQQPQEQGPQEPQRHCHRRDFLLSTVTAVLVTVVAPVGPKENVVAHAKAASTFFYDETIETVQEPAQMPTGDKVDLNSAFVGDYKYFQGMYPHAAGMIASHGPYKTVKDIYKIPNLTDNDKLLFQKYEKFFTVNPPGRVFSERINARVST